MELMTDEKTGFKRTDLGLIPEDWEVVLLKNYTTKIGSGITPRGGKKVYQEYGRPFVRSQNVGWGFLKLDDLAFIDNATHATFDSTEIQEDDVLLNITGASIGRSSIVKSNIIGGNVNQHVCIIRTLCAAIDPKFLNLILLSDIGQKQIDSYQAGGNREGLNFGQIGSFLIPLPPTLEEQQAIADALSDVDELIRSLDALIQKKEAIKKGTMQQLLTGNKRLPGFDGEWEVKNLGDVLIASPDYGINAPAVDYNSNYPTYLRITDISGEGNFVHSGKKSVKAVNSDLYYLSEGEIVLARTGASTGKSYHYKPKDGELVFAGFLIRIKPDPKKAESKFLKYYLQTDQYWNWVEKNSMRSGQPGLNSVQYSSLKISFPNLEEQKAIAQILSDMDEELQALRRKREKMVGVKEGMMQELLTGKTRLV
jgi:type I restriction enzyme S subunit